MKSNGTAVRVLLYGAALPAILGIGLAVTIAQGDATGTKDSSNAVSRLVENYGKLPLNFEANEGQTDRSVQFLSRGQGYQLFLTPTGAMLALQSPSPAVKPAAQTGQTEAANQIALRLQLVGANPHSEVTGENALPGKVNYFLGKDPTQWRTNVPTYQKVRYEEIYPGIDLVYYGQDRQLEYDFIVAPGADPRSINLAFNGQQNLRIESGGDLILKTETGQVYLHKPLAYQEQDGAKQIVESHYVLEGASQVSIEVAAYDSTRPLIIDPVLSYSTFLGGNASDGACCVRVDETGNAYVYGTTSSSNFPTTAGVTQGSLAGGADVFVTKLNPTGTAVLYSTYLGGSGNDTASGGTAAIALDATGNVYLVGRTGSSNFPITAGSFQTTFAAGPNDIFVTKIDPNGSSLLYSTYLGGPQNDEGGAITVDNAGNAYVTGLGQLNFPTTTGALKTTFTAFGEIIVTKLNSTGSSLVYSTYIPTTAKFGVDAGTAIAVDGSGNAYVTGTVRSAIGTPGAFQTTFQGGVNGDVFVLKLNPTGSTLVWATNLGGSSTDNAWSIAIDAAGNSYVCGGTESSNFPTTTGAYQTIYRGGPGVPSDGFVTKVNPAGSALVFSTYLSGNGEEGGFSCSLDHSTGIISAWQWTPSTNMPVTSDALQPSSAGSYEGYIARLNAAGSALLYGSYFGGSSSEFTGGIALDFFSNAYVVGNTSSTNFSTTAGAFQTTYGGAVDAFVTKMQFMTPVSIDIKPGSFPNSINLGSSGVVPVAILGSATFNATQIDPLTVTLADARVKLKGKGTPMASLEDVNGDGFLDLVVQVSTDALQLTDSDTQAIVEGQTYGGVPFRGLDSVRIVPAS